LDGTLDIKPLKFARISAVLAGVVVVGTLVGAGVADAAPAPGPQGSFQTCVTRGIADAIAASRSVPPLGAAGGG
jgi:hypothetical protein